MATVLINLRFPTAAPLLIDQATALPALRADLLFSGLEEDALAGTSLSRFDSCDNQCRTGVKARALIRAVSPTGLTSCLHKECKPLIRLSYRALQGSEREYE